LGLCTWNRPIESRHSVLECYVEYQLRCWTRT